MSSEALPAAGEPLWRRRPALTAFLLVAASAAFHVWYAGRLELSPQEAYYWMWGQRLDWSYFDHPPLAAWTIRALGEVLGDSERAIRSAAALHSALFSLFFYLTARRLLGARAALAATVVGLLTPLFSLGQVIITPDGPMLAMWAAAMYFTLRALDEERGAWLLAAGLATGLAALGKYTGWLLAPQILVLLLLDPRGRRLLRTPWPWIGVLLAAVAFAPVVIWNARHGWASFGFQFGERAHGLASPRLVRVLRFVGLQALLATPVLAVAIWASTAGALFRLRDPRFRFAAVFSLPGILLFAAVSPFAWVKGNWPALAWPAAILATVAFWEEGKVPRWVVRLGVGFALFAVAYVHLAPLVSALPFSGRDDVTRGWRQLAARVEVERARIGPDAFLLGCSYKPSSLLHYYLPGRPETYSAEAMGEGGLQFTYWTDPERLRGRDGLVILDPRDGEPCQSRAQYCSPLVELPPEVVERPGMWRLGGLASPRVTAFRLFRCHYLAPPPRR